MTLKVKISGKLARKGGIIKSDLKDDGLLQRVLKDWANLGDKYTAKLFLKTNVLDSTFFMDYQESANLVKKYKRNN